MYLIINLYTTCPERIEKCVWTRFRQWYFRGIHWAEDYQGVVDLLKQAQEREWLEHKELLMVVEMKEKPPRIAMFGLPYWGGWEKEHYSFKTDDVLGWYTESEG